MGRAKWPAPFLLGKHMYATRIQPWLYQGGQPPGAGAYQQLKKAGVTHILTVNAENPYVSAARDIFGAECVLHIPWWDDGTMKPVEDFRRIYDWARDASADSVFLSHCAMGINRSTVGSVWLITSLTHTAPGEAFNEILVHHRGANGFRIPMYRESVLRAMRDILDWTP